MTGPKGNTVKIRNSTRCCNLQLNEPDKSPLATGESREGVRFGRESEDLPDRITTTLSSGIKTSWCSAGYIVFGTLHWFDEDNES